LNATEMSQRRRRRGLVWFPRQRLQSSYIVALVV
jgi:hypothetical protein